MHLAAGQLAVARAKESELAGEISGLKHLLKESLAERDALHAQLMAKQVSAITTCRMPCSPLPR